MSRTREGLKIEQEFVDLKVFKKLLDRRALMRLSGSSEGFFKRGLTIQVCRTHEKKQTTESCLCLIVAKKGIKTLTKAESWKRIKLTTFDARLLDDVPDSSLSDSMKCCKWLT